MVCEFRWTLILASNCFFFSDDKVDYKKRGEHWDMLVRSSPEDWSRNLETIVQWSPYTSEEDLTQQVS